MQFAMRELLETDPHVLLVLIAVRLLGGRSLTKSNSVFKGLKSAVARAAAQGLIAEEELHLAGNGKHNKMAEKKQKAWTLTARGEAHLKTTVPADVAAAVTARHKTLLLEQLQADREALKREVLTHIDRVFAPLEQKIQAAVKPPAPILRSAVLQHPAPPAKGDKTGAEP
jgi:hypothetical protein